VQKFAFCHRFKVSQSIMPQRSRRFRKNKGVRSSADGQGEAKISSGPQMTTVRIPMKLGNHCPLPMRLVTNFTASGYFSLAAATASYAVQFKLNSPRLPFVTVPAGMTWNNLTPASFQPPGFGILVGSNLYVQGIVQSALVELDFVPQSVLDSVVVGGVPSVTSGVPASVGAMITRPWSKQQTFASGRMQALGDYPWRHQIEPYKFLGIPKSLYDNDQSSQFTFSPSSDPVTQVIYQLQIETGDAANLTQALEGRVRITYTVMLRELSVETLT